MRSGRRGHFNCVKVVLGSRPSIVASIPCSVVMSGRLSSYVVVALAAVIYSVVAFATSRDARTYAASYSFRFCWASRLATTFCFCIFVSSRTTTYGVRHSGGHVSITEKTTSSMAMKGSVVHFCSGSLCALIYTLCISTLKFAKFFRLSYTEVDKRGHLLIHSHMLASISTHKILNSLIRVASFVAHSKAYFATSGQSWSREEN